MPSGFDSRPPPTTPDPSPPGILLPVRVHAGAMPTPSAMPRASRAGSGSPPPTAVGPASPVSPPTHVAEALLRLEREHLAAEVRPRA